MSDDFNWNGDRESVVVPSVRGIAVYQNPKGDIVIRQEAHTYGDDDPFVVVPVLEIENLIKALKNAISASWDGTKND